MEPGSIASIVWHDVHHANAQSCCNRENRKKVPRALLYWDAAAHVFSSGAWYAHHAMHTMHTWRAYTHATPNSMASRRWRDVLQHKLQTPAILQYTWHNAFKEHHTRRNSGGVERRDRSHSSHLRSPATVQTGCAIMHCLPFLPLHTTQTARSAFVGQHAVPTALYAQQRTWLHSIAWLAHTRQPLSTSQALCMLLAWMQSVTSHHDDHTCQAVNCKASTIKAHMGSVEHKSVMNPQHTSSPQHVTRSGILCF